MRKFTYYVARRLDDHPAYSIRAKRRGDVLAELKAIGAKKYRGSEYSSYEEAAWKTDWGAYFGPIEKVTIEYEGIMDLIKMCLGEDSGFWEA